MKLKTFFQHAVEIGISADPRGKALVAKMLRKERERQKKLEGKEKELADPERTWNPYADSRIIAGTGEEEIRHLMVGIDIETPEILLADRLRERGETIDGLLIHHPEGRALADLGQVMALQVDVLGCAGVAVNQAEGDLGPRIDRIHRSIHADNLFRTERAAELLDFPAFCCHTVTDNLVYQFVEKTIAKKEYDDLGEILNALLEIPEYAHYAKKGNPPIITHGNRNGRPGKIVASEFTGGTNGPEEFIERQARVGVGTILSMHVTEKSLEEAKKHHINMVQCSHMASDSIGINLLLDRLKKEEKRLTTLDVSGFVRVTRTK
ncbi:NGG1p interacting factor NIF3 [Candidatus Peregrinibacteria bacterium]|nr:NGG1p interacting factor NIF3 [Candidatus Peregrinibacteria bacterium]MBI4129125.1 NGG1p interacting factor NIF3 [Candidatus Peregrinibacteria bacterium]